MRRSSDEPTQRLEKHDESLETAREHAHIPGMAIAIVKDDEVVLTRGFSGPRLVEVKTSGITISTGTGTDR